ncbi:MAG: penicillin acylase family protein [Gammaproteobacteria bacterium]|nr:penicillin acylase family protein [Gammaproteobacteria bacterium]
MRALYAVAGAAFLAACSSGGDSNITDRTGGVSGGENKATIIRTEYSIPNIQANDWRGAGYGVGYAQAEDNFCLLSTMWVRLDGKASMYNGPRLGKSKIRDDLFFSYINETADIEAIMDLPPPHGPGNDVLMLLDGFVDGYNTYLAEYGANGIPDEDCRGGEWIRSIERIDVARRLYELIGKGGRDLVWKGMVTATPPSLTAVPTLPNSIPLYGRVPGYSDAADQINAGARQFNDAFEQNFPASAAVVDPLAMAALAEAFKDHVEGGGSNGVGLGSEATTNGSGMLLGNPHWGWDGYDRFWQMHVKIPGTVHVSGMGFIGQPLVMIGHNQNVAWTHTVSAARRLALTQLTLVPGSPTTYLVDGMPHEMEATTITVKAIEEDGSFSEHSHTFYDSIYGPITTSILGIDLLPWTHVTAFAMVDMNTGSARIANQFIESNSATSAEDLYRIHSTYSGNPWATTTVADDQGTAMWTDVGTIPNISNDFAARCNTPIGHALWNTFAVAVLNGATLQCEVPSSDDAAAPQTMPAADQPVIYRKDYVENSNESHWLTHAYEKLEGYSRVFGPEGTQRAMRTRIGHRMILDRLEGRDGAQEPLFDRQDLQDLLFSNRNMLGELWADDLAQYCTMSGGRMPATPDVLSEPEMPTPPEFVDVSEACDVIAGWKKTNTLEDPGAVLWYRFAKNALADLDFTLAYAGLPAPPMWTVPYNPMDPVNTPSGLNPAYAVAYNALADTVKEFRENGIPLDASFKTHQLSEYGESRAPLHGGEGTLGLFNAMRQAWRGDHIGAGRSGPSFVQVTKFFKDGSCPDDRTLLLGSQRSEDAWDRADEQQELYSQGKWVDPPFCDDELAAAEKESITDLNNGVVSRR